METSAFRIEPLLLRCGDVAMCSGFHDVIDRNHLVTRELTGPYPRIGPRQRMAEVSRVLASAKEINAGRILGILEVREHQAVIRVERKEGLRANELNLRIVRIPALHGIWRALGVV